MPYIQNVVAVGASSHPHLRRGALVAMPDEPAEATMDIGGEIMSGMRYLIAADDGSGYVSGMPVVLIPKDPHEPVRVSIPPGQMENYRALLRDILGRAPSARLLVYLEANRIISRPDPKEPCPVHPRVHSPMNIAEFLAAAENGRVVEEEVFVVEGEII